MSPILVFLLLRLNDASTHHYIGLSSLFVVVDQEFDMLFHPCGANVVFIAVVTYFPAQLLHGTILPLFFELFLFHSIEWSI